MNIYKLNMKVKSFTSHWVIKIYHHFVSFYRGNLSIKHITTRSFSLNIRAGRYICSLCKVRL